MIKRYKPTKDNTISNAFDSSLVTRAVSASMGQADILENFSIYGQVSSSDGFSTEEARILIEFDLTEIQADITNKIVPAGSSYFLRLYNAEHGNTNPVDFNLQVNSISGSWNEGYGLDMDDYSDLTYGTGSSWVSSNGNPVSATATLDITNDIVLTSVAKGRARNTNTFKTIVNAPAANAADAVLVGFTGTAAAIVCTVTPDDTGPVTLTTAELVELINTGAVVGKTVTITDTSSFRALQTATGGGAQNLAAGGEGDDKTATFSGGDGLWASQGGDTYASPSTTQAFPTGLEDLNLDVTTQVQSWIDGRINDGFMVKLPTSVTDGTIERSFYTKKFFARGSEFFYKRPVLEARWNSTIQDDRINFYASSSLAPAADNLNTLYLYNYHRGQLTNIPAIGTGPIYVDLYDKAGGNKFTQCIDTPATGGLAETGIYTASVCLTTTSASLADVWRSSDATGAKQYHTGSITVKTATALAFAPENDLVVSCVGSQENYYSKSTNRFYFYIREKKWSPNIFTTATSSPTTEVYENLHYKITRLVTDETVFDYDTTTNSTLLSYDSKGNFFDLDLTMLEPNYTYLIELALHSVATKTFEQLSFKHKFRVVNNEY